jgi:flagellar assembly factor FliW
MLQIETKYFGEISYEEEDALTFPNGLFGFEDEGRFLLLPFAGGDGSLLCLQSMTTPALAFVVMNPFPLKPDYAPILPEEELRALGAAQSEDLCYYVLCVVRDPITYSTLNLKCPIVINEDTREAAQVILDTTEYNMRHRLLEFSRQEEGSEPC